MSTEQQRILEMLNEGKLTIDDAERLLRAISGGGGNAAGDGGVADEARTSSSALAHPTPRSAAPRHMRIIVENSSSTERRREVDIRIPLQIIRSGIRLAALLPREARDGIERALHQRGVPFDLSSLTPEEIEQFIESLRELELNVTADNEHVRIFCE